MHFTYFTQGSYYFSKDVVLIRYIRCRKLTEREIVSVWDTDKQKKQI